MAFSSVRFLCFLVVVLGLLGTPIANEKKKRLLAVASCFFYAAWDYRFLALLLLVSFIDYFCAARIDRSEREGVRKSWLTASIVSNLAILGYFKYYNFFAHSVNAIGFDLPFLSILLPAGISFYTFKSMSYTIDVYRREIEPSRSQIDYTTFVTFFPELIAGPIVRASVFLPQMQRRIGPTRERLARGASLFLLGLTKKRLIADRVAIAADQIFANPGLFSGVSIWMGVLAYTIQIYCDFSGYSDMAIGTAKMIGYDLPENFNMPYLSSSITEFWRRWHITLSSWLRDYLYIPLGGNRKGQLRTYLNLTVTMLLGGLWHGASWNFIIWGLLHGLALAAHKLYKQVRGQRGELPAMITGPITFLLVFLCWIPFRAATLDVTRVMLSRMFLGADGVRFYPQSVFWCGAALVTAHIIGVLLSRAAIRGEGRVLAVLKSVDARLEVDSISSWYVRFGTGTISGAFVVSFWLLFLFFFVETNSSPFIYFQF